MSTRAARPHPAGDVPGSRTKASGPLSSSKIEVQRQDIVTHTLPLDAHELFTQLSITAALVQVGPRRGVFLSFIDVVDKRTPRIWREWLAARAEEVTSNRPSTGSDEAEYVGGRSSSMIWADRGKTMGLKVRVKERKWRGDAPILVHKNEDPAISYLLELEGKETVLQHSGVDISV